MAPSFLQATPDRALRFLTSSAVNRRVASSSLARGAKSSQSHKLQQQEKLPVEIRGCPSAAPLEIFSRPERRLARASPNGEV
jgi:hypothetical protein